MSGRLDGIVQYPIALLSIPGNGMMLACGIPILVSVYEGTKTGRLFPLWRIPWGTSTSLLVLCASAPTTSSCYYVHLCVRFRCWNLNEHDFPLQEVQQRSAQMGVAIHWLDIDAPHDLRWPLSKRRWVWSSIPACNTFLWCNNSWTHEWNSHTYCIWGLKLTKQCE